MDHKSRLTKTYPSGAQKWDCDICERSILWQTNPRLKYIVLNEGNPTISHTGVVGLGDIKLSSFDVDIETSEGKELLDQVRDIFK